LEILNQAASAVTTAKVGQFLEKVDDLKKDIKKVAEDKVVQVQKLQEVITQDPTEIKTLQREQGAG
jgi:hypothetical protein